MISNLPVSKSAKTLRFGMHAHPYAPAYTLVTLQLAQNAMPGTNGAIHIAAVSVLYALPATVFVVSKPLLDKIFENRSRETALATGMGCVCIGCAAAAATFLSLAFGLTEGWTTLIAFALTQLVLGLGLASIDGADRDLLALDLQHRRGDSSSIGDDDRRELRAMDWRLRAKGVAAAAFIGALLFAVTLLFAPVFYPGTRRFDPHGSVPIAGFIVFATTAGFQALRIAHLRRLAARVPELRFARSTAARARPLLEIRNDADLRTLVPLLSIVDGWLIFLGLILSTSAMREFVIQFGSNWWLGTAVLAAVFLGATSSSPILGNILERRMRPPPGREGSQLPAAIAVIAIGVAALTVYLIFCSATATLGLDPMVALAAKSSIFVVALVLRGFAQPRLSSTLDERLENVKCRCPLGVRGLASLGARLVQVITTAVAITAAWLLSNAPSGSPSLSGDWAAPSVFKHTLTVGATTVLMFLCLFGGLLHNRRLWNGLVACVQSIPSWRLPPLRGRRTLYLCFALCLIAANALTTRSTFGILTFLWGAIPYALAFVFVDAAVERHGRAEWARLLVLGLIVNILGAVVAQAVTSGAAMTTMRNNFVASTCSFAVAIGIEGEMFSNLRRLCKGSCLWARVMITGFVAQAVDSLVFIPVVTYLNTGTLGIDLALAGSVHGQMLIKWAVSIVFFRIAYIWKTPWMSEALPVPSPLDSPPTSLSGPEPLVLVR